MGPPGADSSWFEIHCRVQLLHLSFIHLFTQILVALLLYPGAVLDVGNGGGIKMLQVCLLGACNLVKETEKKEITI